MGEAKWTTCDRCGSDQHWLEECPVEDEDEDEEG